MKIVHYACIMLIILIPFACQEKAGIRLPVIEINDSENIFTFTNKNSGVYLGQTHGGKAGPSTGWFVDGYHYLNYDSM